MSAYTSGYPAGGFETTDGNMLAPEKKRCSNCCACMNWTCCICWIVLVGITWVFAALLVMWVWNGIEDCLIITKEDVGNDCYDAWQSNTDPDDPDWLWEMYYYNVTNMDGIMNNGETPLLNEVGPYVFQKFKSKEKIRWFDNEEMVELWDYTWYTYRPDLSSGAESDMIYVVNPVSMALMFALDDATAAQVNMLLQDMYCDPTTGACDFSKVIFQACTAREQIFGCENELLADLLAGPFASLVQSFGITSSVVTISGNATSIEMGETVLGWTNETFYTGKKDRELNGRLHIYQNQSEYTGWGESFSFDKMAQYQFGIDTLKDNEELPIYISEAYRPVNFEVIDNDLKFHDVSLYRYKIADYELDSVFNHPDNAKWYQDYYTGVANISHATGNPTFLSKRHFKDCTELLGSNNDINAYYGLTAGPSEADDPYIDIEPMTGFGWAAHKPLQFNTFIQCNDNLPGGTCSQSGLPAQPMMYPLYANVEHGSATKENADDFKKFIIDNFMFARLMGFLGLIFLIFFIIHVCTWGGLWWFRAENLGCIECYAN